MKVLIVMATTVIIVNVIIMNKIWNNTKDVNKVIDLINFEIDNCCMDYSIAFRLIFKLVSLRNRYLYREVC